MKLALKVLGGFALLLVLVFAASLAFPAFFAPRYQLITTPSGQTHKIIATGPIVGKSWHGMVVKYLAESDDPAVLESSAADIFELIRQKGLPAGIAGVVISAVTVTKQVGPFTSSSENNIVFTPNEAGVWQHTAVARRN